MKFYFCYFKYILTKVLVLSEYSPRLSNCLIVSALLYVLKNVNTALRNINKVHLQLAVCFRHNGLSLLYSFKVTGLALLFWAQKLLCLSRAVCVGLEFLLEILTGKLCSTSNFNNKGQSLCDAVFQSSSLAGIWWASTFHCKVFLFASNLITS